MEEGDEKRNQPGEQEEEKQRRVERKLKTHAGRRGSGQASAREKDRKEAANSFGVSLEGARQKRGRRGAEQKQSGDFQEKTRVAKNQ